MAKILIVDDSKTMRSIIKAMLIKIGHEVVGEASNGLDGYDYYFRLKPDIVTMDITMPILDGASTLRKIREADPTAKIIVLSSNAQSEKLADTMSAGACGYIFKPLVEKDLREAIDKVLS